MFDVGVADLIQGPEIDRPLNALTLTHDWHYLFGAFEVYFESEDAKKHVYKNKSHKPTLLEPETYRDPGSGEPYETRELYLMEDRAIDPPHPRLLAIHRAISHILHLSRAGEYIDRVYEDLEKHSVKEDESTPLGRLVSLVIREHNLSVHT
jgi:hypothetical protein